MELKLEHYLPRWVLTKIETRSCTSCKYKFKKVDIVQVGVRKIKVDDKNSHAALAVETWCPHCQKGSVTTFAQEKYRSFRNLLCSLLKEIQKIDKINDARSKAEIENKSRSKITDEEVLKFKKTLDNCETHMEFLKELGIELDEN